MNKLDKQLFDASCQRNINKALKALEKGANINAQARTTNQTALMMACAESDVKMVDLLLNAGADIHLLDCDKRNALIYAFQGPYNVFDDAGLPVKSEEPAGLKIAKKLIAKGADIHIKDKHQMSVLFFAIDRQDINAVKYLVDLGVDPAEKLPDGYNYLMFASGHNKSIEIVRFFLDHYDLHGKDNGGNTALHHAASYLENIQFLLENGAKDLINVQDNNGNTVLMRAAERVKYDCVRFLIQSGADWRIRNKDGLTAFDLAQQYKSMSRVFKRIEKKEETVELLRSVMNQNELDGLVAKKDEDDITII